MQGRAERWHSPTAPATGFLFHEPDGLPSEVDDWRAINAAGYDRQAEGIDRVRERCRYPLFQSLASELHRALQDAARIARDEPDRYYRLLTAGIAHIRRNFSWDQAALDYVKHIV